MKKQTFWLSTACLLVSACTTSNNDGVIRVSLKPQSIQNHTPSDNSLIKVPVNVANSVPTIKATTPQPAPKLSSLPNNSMVSNSNFRNIIESALAYNAKTSPLPLTVEQREAEADAIRKNNWPIVQPAARWGSRTSAYFGVDAAYTLLDFGASSQKEKQGDLAIDVSKIDFYLEQRGIVADVLSELAKIAALKEKVALTSNSLKALDELSRYAAIRVDAGFINESEPLLLNLRIAELRSEMDAMEVEITLKTKLLSAKLLSPITAKDVPSFAAMNAGLNPVVVPDALQMRRAKLAVDMAQAKLKQTERERFPQVNVEGGIGLTSGSSKNHSVGLVLKSPTSIFTGGASVRAAESALKAAQQEANQTQVKVDTEWERIALERDRLVNNRRTLKQLERESEHSLNLFKSQFEAATATVSDGLSAHRTLLQTRQQLIDLEAELLNLKASEIRISDGQFLKP